MNQSDSGKSFEAAVMQELLRRYLSMGIEVVVLGKSLPYYNKARESLTNADAPTRDLMMKAAVIIIDKLVEKRATRAFIKQSTPVELCFGTSTLASQGDVRDIIIETQKSVYGLSLKWNSDEIKSFRLGGDWLHNISGIPLDVDLWQNDTQPFLHHIGSEVGSDWKEIKTRLVASRLITIGTNLYAPLRDGLKNQLLKLKGFDNSGALKFIDFIFGTKDYEKIMVSVHESTVTFVSYKDKIKPREIVVVRPWRDGSNEITDNYVEVLFDKGWSIKIRIKNGDSKVKENVLSGIKTTVTVCGWGPVVPEIIPLA